MARPILNPETASSSGRTTFSELPPEARKFGLVPDVKELLPGDAVLVASRRVSFFGRLVEKFQLTGGFAAGDACWTHVAVYIGQAVVVEAMPWHGVRTNSIYNFVPKRLILVRRDPNLDNEKRYRIAIQAATRLKRGYSLLRLPSMAAGAAAGFWNPDTAVRMTRVLVCSTLYSDSYVAVLQNLLYPDRISNLWPSHISATPLLTDVEVPWIAVR